MAYITVTSTTNQVIIDTGVYGGMSTAFGPLPNKATMPKGHFKIQYFSNVTYPYIELLVINGTNIRVWSFNLDGSGGVFRIESVAGIIPTDMNDLWTKVAALTA